jgi:hypothetical protein
MMDDMRIRIDAVDLPGPTFRTGAVSCQPGAGGGSTYRDVRVAVQRRGRPGELLDPQSGGGASATWTLECATAATPAGTDVRGPYVQGPPGGRFVYLWWDGLDESGALTMFRRAKLMLGAVPADVVAAALRTGLLVARLGLTDARGGPLCARVVPPTVVWAAR